VNNTWKLRILNTDHAGAEVVLNQSMTLGSDEEHADLVLSADFLAPSFITLTPDEEGVKLRVLDSNVDIRMNGELLDEDEYTPEQSVIFIGDLAIAIRPEQSEWSESVLTFDPNTYMHEASPDEFSAPTRSLGERVIASWHYYTHLPLFRVCAIGGAVALCGALVVVWGLPNDPDLAPGESPIADILVQDASAFSLEQDAGFEIPRELAALLDTDEYSDVSISPVKGTAYVEASGYVEDDLTLSRLHQQIDQLHPAVNVAVYSNEQIKQSARLILANLGLVADDIKKGDDAGEFVAVIDGDYIKTWEGAERFLTADIPGLKSWELEVKQKLAPLERLKQLAARHPFANKLAYVDREKKIQIIARLNSTEEKALVELIDEFRARVGEYPALEHIIPDLPARALNLNDFGISAVRSGDTPYVTYRNGKRYLLGARLPNGVTIEQFAEGEITVLRGAAQYVIRYKSDQADSTDIAYRDLATQ